MSDRSDVQPHTEPAGKLIAAITDLINNQWVSVTGASMGFGAPEDRLKDYRLVLVDDLRSILEDFS